MKLVNIALTAITVFLLSACGPDGDGTQEAEQQPSPAPPVAFEPMGNLHGVEFEEASGIAFHHLYSRRREGEREG